MFSLSLVTIADWHRSYLELCNKPPTDLARAAAHDFAGRSVWSGLVWSGLLRSWLISAGLIHANGPGWPHSRPGVGWLSAAVPGGDCLPSRCWFQEQQEKRELQSLSAQALHFCHVTHATFRSWELITRPAQIPDGGPPQHCGQFVIDHGCMKLYALLLNLLYYNYFLLVIQSFHDIFYWLHGG